MAKPKTPPTDKAALDATAAALQAQAAEAMSAANLSSSAQASERTDQELYGDVKPTMVNGVYIGGDPKLDKPAPTLTDEIAAAFTNERQIAVLTRLLATPAFVDVGTPTGSAPLAANELTDLRQRNSELEDEVDVLTRRLGSTQEGLDQMAARLTALETRLATMAADAPEATNPLPGPSAS